MIEKSLRRDHRLSSLCKPHDAKWLSSGRIFLSYPHTHDIFLIYTIPILGHNFSFSFYFNTILARSVYRFNLCLHFVIIWALMRQNLSSGIGPVKQKITE